MFVQELIFQLKMYVKIDFTINVTEHPIFDLGVHEPSEPKITT